MFSRVGVLWGRFLAFASTKFGLAVVLAVVAAGGYAFYSSTRPPQLETLVAQAGEFKQQVSVSGKVTPAHDVDLGFTQSGRVATVSVSVGQTVSAGTVLASIDNGDIRAQLLQRQAALDAQKARLAALKAGTRPEEIAVAESTVQSDTVALQQASDAVMNSVRDAYAKTDAAIRINVYQFISNPRTNPQLAITSTASQASIDLISNIADVESRLNAWQQDLGIMTVDNLSARVLVAQDVMSRASTLLSNASKVLNTSLPSGGVTQATLDTYSSAVSTARTSVNTAISSLTSAVTAQKAAAAALDAAQKTLTLKKAGSLPEDIDAQAAQVKAAEADIANVQSMLSRTLIVAPFTGVITKVDTKVGKIVSPNSPEISMDSAGAFQIESYIPEVNVALVKVGDPASVTLDAYGDSVPFSASVVSIDPAETIRDGVPTYRALLLFASADERIRSGMTANIVIITAKRAGVIAVPQGLIIEKESKKYVKVLESGAVVEREVTTGSVSSDGTIEILSGLKDGDIVVVKESA